MGRNPKATVDIRQVNVQRNEALAVYFQVGSFDEPEIVQFEARVNEAGQIELFCDEHVLVQPFTKWASLDGGGMMTTTTAPGEVGR